jgi:cell division protein ZapA
VSSENVPITIKVLDKEFRIACPESEQASLLESANYLSDKMREVRDTGKVIGMDRIAVMTALNLAHELLQSKSEQVDFTQNFGHRLELLQDKIDTALNNSKQMEL